MKISIASDHAGFNLKESIKDYLQNKYVAPIEVVDLGTHSTESVDYPIYGKACAEAVSNGSAELGIVVCGSGIGISIAANKVAGIRCALCVTEQMARMAKRHNNANMISLGANSVDEELAFKIVTAWLEEEFEGGRHERRVNML